jgi:hypothetical protein
MLASLRSHVAHNVVGYLALFIALGGTSYAVATGSINSRAIKNNTVRSKDIRNNDVRSKDVRNRSLLAKDFAPGQLPAGPRGQTGPQGETGPQGPQGPSAASAFSGGGFSQGAPADDYCGPTTVQAVNTCASDEMTQQNERSALSPNATIVARDLFVKQAEPNGGSRTFTLRVEGTDTAVGCSINGLATTCNSDGATATIPPGSRILLHVVATNAAISNGFWFGWRATTP